MSTHNIHLKYRTLKRYPTIISIVPPGVAPIVTFRGSNYRCLEQIFMVLKGFEPSKFDCMFEYMYKNKSNFFFQSRVNLKSADDKAVLLRIFQRNKGCISCKWRGQFT